MVFSVKFSSVKTRFDPHTEHAPFDTGWQMLTLCGRRVNFLHGKDKVRVGSGLVNCPECTEIMYQELEHRNGRENLVHE